MLEHVLAGSIGAASAHNALEQTIKYSERESSELKALYSHIMTGLGSQSVVQQEDTEEDMLPNGFGMISNLQSQIDLLESTVIEQRKSLDALESKLEARYEEVFRYRVESQRVTQENIDLREQIAILTRRESSAKETPPSAGNKS